MLKVSATTSASLRAASVDSPAGSSASAASGFSDILEAVQQVERGAAAPVDDNEQPPRPAASDKRTVSSDTNGALLPANAANLPTTSRDRGGPDAPSRTKASGHPPVDSATDASAAAPVVVPDAAAAAAIMQALVNPAGQPNGGAGDADVQAAQPSATGAGRPDAAGGGGSPSAAVVPGETELADDAAAELDPGQVNSSVASATIETILSDALPGGAPSQSSGLQTVSGTLPSGASIGTGATGMPGNPMAQLASANATDPSLLSAAGQASQPPSTANRTTSGAPSTSSDAARATHSDTLPGATAPLSDATAASLSTVVKMVQRVTGTGVDSIAFSKGSRPGASAASIADTGTAVADQGPVAAVDGVDAAALSSGLETSNPLADADPASAGLLSAVVSSITHRAEREAVPTEGHEAHAAQAADGQAVAPDTTGVLPPVASTADAVRPPPAGGGAAPSVASQVAPALVTVAQGGGVGGRLSISITPDQLGQVHITVERATDGTTSIHVAADQLGTLDMLRHDQSDLTRALDQAGIRQEGHSLSFSWNGGGGGMQGWDGWGNQANEPQPAQVSGSYAAEPTPVPAAAVAAAARGGIDVTA